MRLIKEPSQCTSHYQLHKPHQLYQPIATRFECSSFSCFLIPAVAVRNSFPRQRYFLKIICVKFFVDEADKVYEVDDVTYTATSPSSTFRGLFAAQFIDAVRQAFHFGTKGVVFRFGQILKISA
jgi:hypothetical protein